jgi:hypothetical protein
VSHGPGAVYREAVARTPSAGEFPWKTAFVKLLAQVSTSRAAMETTVADAIAIYCPNCDRVVYLGEDDTSVCPVCATPLITTQEDDGGS